MTERTRRHLRWLHPRVEIKNCQARCIHWVPVSLDSPAAFPSPWIKASGFASHPFGWFALYEHYFLDRINRVFQVI
jgi:hypothetical protein